MTVSVFLSFLDRTKCNCAQFSQGQGKCFGLWPWQPLTPYATLRVFDIPDPFCHTVKGRSCHSDNMPHWWFTVGPLSHTLTGFSPGLSLGSHCRPVTKQRLGSKAWSKDIGYFLGRQEVENKQNARERLYVLKHSHSNLPTSLIC